MIINPLWGRVDGFNELWNKTDKKTKEDVLIAIGKLVMEYDLNHKKK